MWAAGWRTALLARGQGRGPQDVEGFSRPLPEKELPVRCLWFCPSPALWGPVTGMASRPLTARPSSCAGASLGAERAPVTVVCLQVREALQHVPGRYEDFLQVIHGFESGPQRQTAVELYGSLRLLLRDWPQLLKDFAAFLLPEQALACGLVSRRAKTLGFSDMGHVRAMNPVQYPRGVQSVAFS